MREVSTSLRQAYPKPNELVSFELDVAPYLNA